MTQTERSSVAIRALLADNASGAISPQDLRDAFASMMGYGGMILTIAGKPATMTAVGPTPMLVDVFDLVTVQSSDVNLNGVVASLSPTYDFVIGATGIYRVEFFASFSTSANNHLVTFTPFVNGSMANLETDRWIGTQTDTGVSAMFEPTEYTAGDKIDMRVHEDAGSINLTFLAAGFNIYRVG